MAPRASAAAGSPPGTPPRRGRRALGKTFSDPKAALPPSLRRALEPAASDPKEPEPKARRRDAGVAAAQAAAAPAAGAATGAGAHDAELLPHLARHGVPESGRARLMPLLRRWGAARASQVLGLWTLLGDGAERPIASPAAQAWGPAGTGKSEVVLGYLAGLGIRHVRLNCASVPTLGELMARLAEELRRAAVEASARGEAPRALQSRVPPGRQLRAVDRFEAAARPPLEHLAQLAREDQEHRTRGANAPADARPGVSDKVVVVLDHAQELARLGPAVIDSLLALPEVLRRGDQLVFLFVGRLPLSGLGASPEREPPQVAFPPYSADEAEAVLFRTLRAKIEQASHLGEAVAEPAAPTDAELRALCSSGLLKFAAPHVGHNLHDLLWVGAEVLATPETLGAGMAALQRRVGALVQERLGLCDLAGLADEGPSGGGLDAAALAARMAMQGATKTEKRLVLAAYLAARIDAEDDAQLFVPGGRSRLRRRGAATRAGRAADDTPVWLRAPRPTPLVRVLAVYHRLARQAQALDAPLLEQLAGLREAGLLRFAGAAAGAADKEPRVACRVELPLAKACAAELNIDLAEYLCVA